MAPIKHKDRLNIKLGMLVDIQRRLMRTEPIGWVIYGTDFLQEIENTQQEIRDLENGSDVSRK